MVVTRPAPRSAQGGRGCAACCACVARCCMTIVPPRLCPLRRSAGAGYRLLRNLWQVPHPPFFRRCVCERRILSASCHGCRAGALCPGCRACCACIGCVCVSLSMGIACDVWPIWLLRYALPLTAVYTTLRPYICRCSHCARCGYAARCASYMLPMCVYIAQAPALDHVQRERLRYVMRLFCRSCVRLRVRAMRADILPRRCQ